MQLVDLDAARNAAGLRLVVTIDFPSPWPEAARTIFDLKRVPYLAVRYRPNHDALREWTGTHNAPVAILDDQAPQSNWADILVLAEQLAPEPRLVPTSSEEKVNFYGLAHALMGPLGLCWQTRLLLIDVSLATGGRCGFPLPFAEYLARKYGYSNTTAENAHAYLNELVAVFTERVQSAKSKGHRYVLGAEFTAIDVYLIVALRVLRPLDEELARMSQRGRHMLGSALSELQFNVPRSLLDYREFVYREHLLPLYGQDSNLSRSVASNASQ